MDRKILNKFKKQSSLDQDLLKIYSDSNGNLTDVTKLDHIKPSRLKIVFGLLLFMAILFALSSVGLVFFTSKGKYSGKSIELNINAPKEIASGDELKYIINYKNLSNVNLLNSEIAARYPDGFTFISSEPLPKNQYNNSWDVGQLIKNQQGSIIITGKIVGEVGSVKNLAVTTSFQPENFSSPFKESTNFETQITSSILTIDITGPDQALPGKKISYTIKYKNSSEKDLADVQINATYPSKFIFQNSKPSPKPKDVKGSANIKELDKINNIWYFDALKSKQEGEITIEGGFPAENENQNLEFKAQVGFLDKDDIFSLQQEKILITKVIQHGMTVNLIINGTASDQPINFGGTLNYSIVYKNLGQQTLNDVQIIANIESDILDWNTLSDKNLGTVDKNKITWNKNNIASLAQLNPLDEGTLDFSVNIKDLSAINVEKDSLQIKSSANVIINKIDEIEAQTELTTNTITNNINTDLQLKAEGRYFDDDNMAVGSGPLPPVVGQKTVYRVFWSLANNIHEVSDIKVTTTLSPGVNWENKSLISTGKLEYDKAKNLVTWTISRIPPNKSFEEINSWFDLSITPTKDQIGKLILLTTETNLTALDKQTNAQIVQMKRSITTNLEDDPNGGGKGLVVELQ